MSPAPGHAVMLSPHPGFRSGAVHAVSARVRRIPGGLLSIGYCLEGDLERIRVPPPGPWRRAARLWEHTCCELFVAREGSSAYHEFNFSPSGEWAACAFTRYREGGPLADEALNPRIAVRRGPQRLELDASVQLDRLSLAGTALALGLCAVLEQRDGTLSYWALKHPPGKPDFHHPESFALEIDEVRH
jgi:hypothetical protein